MLSLFHVNIEQISLLLNSVSCMMLWVEVLNVPRLQDAMFTIKKISFESQSTMRMAFPQKIHPVVWSAEYKTGVETIKLHGLDCCLIRQNLQCAL